MKIIEVGITPAMVAEAERLAAEVPILNHSIRSVRVIRAQNSVALICDTFIFPRRPSLRGYFLFIIFPFTNG